MLNITAWSDWSEYTCWLLSIAKITHYTVVSNGKRWPGSMNHVFRYHVHVTLIYITHLNIAADPLHPFMTMVFSNCSDLFLQDNVLCDTRLAKIHQLPQISIWLSICSMCWPNMSYSYCIGPISRLKGSGDKVLVPDTTAHSVFGWFVRGQDCKNSAKRNWKQHGLLTTHLYLLKLRSRILYMPQKSFGEK